MTKEDKYMRFGPIDSKLKVLELELGTFFIADEIRAWLKRLSAGIASSKLALQYYTKYVLFNVLLISQAEMIAELKTH